MCMDCHAGLDISIFVYRALDRLATIERLFVISVHFHGIKPSEGRTEPYRESYRTPHLDNFIFQVSPDSSHMAANAATSTERRVFYVKLKFYLSLLP